MQRLANGQVGIGFDDTGRLVELLNRSNGHNYAGGGVPWRLIYQRGLGLEYEARGEGDVPRMSAEGDTVRLHYEGIAGEDGPLKVDVTVEATLDGDEVRWAIEVVNRDESAVVREVHFPLLAPCGVGADQGLIWSVKGGQKFDDLRAAIAKQHTQYMAPDQEGVVLATLYPGWQAACNFYLIAGGGHGLYVGSHDPSFQFTLHLLRLRGGEVDAGLVKYPFLRAGEKVRLEGYVTAPYNGSWHVAAGKYRAWAESWYRAPAAPGWVQRMTGWQRLIMRHQYGQVLLRYDELAGAYAEGAVAGVDAVMPLGWHRWGHDSGYPDYALDPSQGGREGMARAVREVQGAGGRVILYFNGRLIDRNTDYYRGIGHRLAIADAEGNEQRECYRFSGQGTALRTFGHKSFALACYGCAEWEGQLRKMADTAIELGCDAVFFDQLGGGDGYLCWSAEHGHPVPFTGLYQVKAELLGRMRQYVKERKPEMGFGTELLADVAVQHADFVHNWWGACELTGPAAGWQRLGSEGFIELFRYVFPEVILSDREIRDDTDIERRVNHAVIKGLRSDVEVHRGRATLAAAPHYRDYLGQINALRKRQAELLLAGRYLDTQGFMLENPAIDARAFAAGERLAVVLTQSHLPGAATRLVADGFEFASHDGVGNYAVEPWADGVEVRLQRHAVVVAVFRQAGG